MQSAESSSVPGSSLSEKAHALLKRDILAAALVPGERLKLEALSARYGIGVVPIREALNRLSSEGFVKRQSQRGFEVARMSLSSLEELVKTRIWLETKALKESVSATTQEWEEQVLLAYHRLERTPRMICQDNVQQLNPSWETRHKTYHMELISNCGSSWLLEFCSTMMDQSVRYRNVSVNASEARSDLVIVEEHRGILDAILDHDGARFANLLEAHYTKTLITLQTVLEDEDVNP